MTVARRQQKWTVEEFFAWHELQEERYELVAGYPVLKRQAVPVLLPGQSAPTMMTGASRRHNQVNINLSSLIAAQLRGGQCGAFANDAAVRTAHDQLRYPDLVVDCGTPIDGGYVFEHPRLVAEILSPSTRSFDLAQKMTEYWRIEGLGYILIIDPEQQRAQLHERQAGRSATVHLYDAADDGIELPDIGVSLRLGDIFAGLPPASKP